ncbi:antitoxin HicB [bacterium (Candidatus Gribaldobacteria) CG_4_8_14_3_um_filter_42_11]|uniref:Antitoxin HicB n=2 Tax=Candidatus Gribaldobacteria TaxID=2798536 RepID=A0A2H0V0C2_9BACT|nr:MAG: antitoxin HicB [bacterium (Candidatus Gribaldobacteria) CG10_big_fil_rev_8_21_14_0_10_41_12]PIX03271.1 MAG: antitoxin HicB [bacterium (Candidatus Gribaldobacteria) CG_4_8_14_3_um_filter_42_11]
MATKQIKQFNVIFRAEPEGGFTAIAPSLPGCISYGRNLQEAKKMATNAINGYIASLEKHKEPIPSDENNFFALIQASSKSYPLYA